MKKEQKKQKKLIEKLCAEEGNFAEPGSAELVKNLESIDQIGKVLDIETLTAIATELASTTDRKQVFDKAVQMVQEKIDAEKMSLLSKTMKGVSVNGDGGECPEGIEGLLRPQNFTLENPRLSSTPLTLFSSSSVASSSAATAAKEWNQDEVQLLIKAVNLFPAGTTDRWEVSWPVDREPV